MHEEGRVTLISLIDPGTASAHSPTLIIICMGIFWRYKLSFIHLRHHIPLRSCPLDLEHRVYASSAPTGTSNGRHQQPPSFNERANMPSMSRRLSGIHGDNISARHQSLNRRHILRFASLVADVTA